MIDDALVQASDLGNNFFVDRESLGQSRAETVTRMLLEMNPFVEGKTVKENVHRLIDENIDFFSKFTLVLADSVREPQLRKLADFLWKHRIPLVVTRSYGFIGYVRLVIPDGHGIVEAHPPEVHDLRLQDPWHELQSYMDGVDLEPKEGTESQRVAAHSHIPWLVLVFRLYQQHKKENGGQECPRKDFSKYLLSHRITNSITGGKHVEENFDEAAKNGWRAFSKYSIPSHVTAILDDHAVNTVSASSPPFWLLVAALKRFVHKEGHSRFLPLAGGIPDMHSSTANYMALQKIYQEKAEKDVAAFSHHLDEVIKQTGFKGHFSHEEIKRFCKNSANLRLIRYKPYAHLPSGEDLSARLNDEDQPEGKNILWYLLISAAQAFEAQHGRLPGDHDKHVESDIALLRKQFDHVVKTIGVVLSDNVASQVNDHVHEMVRYGGAEMHNIAAFNGGVTSLEIIKVVTHQWVPLDSVFIFNGINGTAVSFA